MVRTGSPLRVNVIYDRYPHHAAHSGYPRLVDALSARVEVRRLHETDAPTWPAPVARRLVARSRMPRYTTRCAQLEFAAALRLWRSPPEICHFFYPEQNFCFAGRVVRARRGAIVCTYHQERQFLDRFVPDKRVLATADVIVAVARWQAQMLSRFTDEERVFFVPLGVDTDFYRPHDAVPDRFRRVIFVGDHLRDFELLTAVVRRLAHSDPAIEFETITSPTRRDELQRLPNVTARAHISDADLLNAYRAADMLVLPLLDSTANNALLEALSCGLPIVTTDVGGVRDYVDERCARIVPARDVEAMCRAVLDLLADPVRRLSMGRASRERALTFDWSLVAARQVEVYRQALERRAVLR